MSPIIRSSEDSRPGIRSKRGSTCFRPDPARPTVVLRLQSVPSGSAQGRPLKRFPVAFTPVDVKKAVGADADGIAGKQSELVPLSLREPRHFLKTSRGADTRQAIFEGRLYLTSC